MQAVNGQLVNLSVISSLKSPDIARGAISLLYSTLLVLEEGISHIKLTNLMLLPEELLPSVFQRGISPIESDSLLILPGELGL